MANPISESEVVRIIESTVSRNNESPLVSMLQMLDTALPSIKRINSESADIFLREVKSLNTKSHVVFKKI